MMTMAYNLVESERSGRGQFHIMIMRLMGQRIFKLNYQIRITSIFKIFINVSNSYSMANSRNIVFNIENKSVCVYCHSPTPPHLNVLIDESIGILILTNESQSNIIRICICLKRRIWLPLMISYTAQAQKGGMPATPPFTTGLKKI